MKLFSINNTDNINFNGMYKELPPQKDKKIRLEYASYSWENNLTSTPSKAKILDISDSVLPDNEVIYTKTKNGDEYLTDIFGKNLLHVGSNGYSVQADLNSSMNLEESLIQQNKKLELFLKMKNQKLSEIAENTSDYYSKSNEMNEKFNLIMNKSKKSFFKKLFIKDETSGDFKGIFSNLISIFKDCLFDFREYIEINTSSEEIIKKIDKNNLDILFIQQQNQEKRLIDVSNQAKLNPNVPLIKELSKSKPDLSKFVALPDRIMELETVYKNIGDCGKNELPQAVEKFIKSLSVKKNVRKIY